MTVESLPSNSPPPQKTKRRWLSVGALSAASMVDFSESLALSALWPQMHRSLNVSVGQLGPVAGIGELVATLTLPLWGYAADRFSRKWLLVFFTGIWGLWTAAIGFINTIPQLMVVRALAGLGLGVFLPTAFSLVGDLFDNKHRGRAIGIIQACGMVGIMITFGALPIFAESDPEAWRWGFILLGVASFISALLMLFLYDPPRGAAEPELQDVVTTQANYRYNFKWRDLRGLVKIRSWWWLVVKDVLDGMSLLVFYRWAFPWLDELGLGETAVPVIIYIFVSLIVGQIVMGSLGDWLEQRFPVKGRLTLVFIGLAIQLPGSLLAFNANADNLPWLLMALGLFIIGSSASSEGVRWPIAQGVLSPELRGSGQAFSLMISGLVNSVMLVISGSLVDQLGGIAPMLLVIFPIPIILSLFAWLPLFRVYGADQAALHRQLAKRRDTLMDERGAN
ncbi:MAG: MFS transporter [Chloroflexota bacterium]